MLAQPVEQRFDAGKRFDLRVSRRVFGKVAFDGRVLFIGRKRSGKGGAEHFLVGRAEMGGDFGGFKSAAKNRFHRRVPRAGHGGKGVEECAVEVEQNGKGAKLGVGHKRRFTNARTARGPFILGGAMSQSNPVRVLVWDENPPHAKKEIYPDGIRTVVADALNQRGEGRIQADTAHLDDPDQGITSEKLARYDVLLWWGHARHGEVEDSVAQLVKTAVHQQGLGFIPLHSGHYSKTYKAVLESTGDLKGGWREIEGFEPEEITVCAPRHPIAAGIEDFTLPEEEMYGSPFGAPPFQTLVFQSFFPHGSEYFPCGFALSVGEGIDPKFTSGGGKGANQGEGKGRVFYFRPGHETVPTYHNESVQKIIRNAVLWCARRS